MAKQIVEVGDANFDQEVLSSGLPTLVDFWGPGCGPCRALEPILEQLADAYAGRVKVAKVNVDSNFQTAVRFGVKSLPTLLLFHGGQVKDQFTGRPTLQAIEKFISPVLSQER
jgi:thioredoxin 1